MSSTNTLSKIMYDVLGTCRIGQIPPADVWYVTQAHHVEYM